MKYSGSKKYPPPSLEVIMFYCLTTLNQSGFNVASSAEGRAFNVKVKTDFYTVTYLEQLLVSPCCGKTESRCVRSFNEILTGRVWVLIQTKCFVISYLCWKVTLKGSVLTLRSRFLFMGIRKSTSNPLWFTAYHSRGVNSFLWQLYQANNYFFFKDVCIMKTTTYQKSTVCSASAIATIAAQRSSQHDISQPEQDPSQVQRSVRRLALIRRMRHAVAASPRNYETYRTGSWSRSQEAWLGIVVLSGADDYMKKIIHGLIACDYPSAVASQHNKLSKKKRQKEKKEKWYIDTVGRMDCCCTCVKELFRHESPTGQETSMRTTPMWTQNSFGFEMIGTRM